VSKKNIVKVAGFIGTLGAGAALVATAATGTGAWFTDSEAGSMAASTGHLNVNLISGHRNMSFQNLMPGDYQTDSVAYQVNQSSGKSDVWLVFDKENTAVAQFTGAKNDPTWPDGGMGRYGHFAVKANGTTVFQSNNLAHAENPSDPAQCAVDANGHGGSSARPSNRDETIPYCGVPYAIKLASNLSNGATGSLALEFGVTGRWTAQDVTLPTVPFSIVAVQAGHAPDLTNADDF
jgi:hypothetical protein